MYKIFYKCININNNKTKNKMVKKEQQTANFVMMPETEAILLNKKLDCLQSSVDKLLNKQGEENEWLNVQQTADFLTLTVPTIYSKVSKREIPFSKRDKRLYFLKSDLIEYIKDGRVKTVSEVEAEADQFLTSKKRK